MIEGEYELTDSSNIEFKGGHGELEIGLLYKLNTIGEDLFTGKIVGVKGGFTGLENTISIKNPYVSKILLTQKFVDSSVAFGVDEYTFKDEMKVSGNKYEAVLDRIDIPDSIPFLGDYDIELKGEFGLGTLGYKVHRGQETVAYVGLRGVGGGVFANFKKHGEED